MRLFDFVWKPLASRATCLSAACLQICDLLLLGHQLRISGVDGALCCVVGCRIVAGIRVVVRERDEFLRGSLHCLCQFGRAPYPVLCVYHLLWLNILRKVSNRNNWQGRLKLFEILYKLKLCKIQILKLIYN